MKSFRIILILAIFAVLFYPAKAHAATLINAKDTISTSRPSASSPLSSSVLNTDTQASIYNNGSRFLASDSAKVIKSATGAIVDAGTIVSSQSAALTTVFFGETTGNAAVANADVLFTPITAMHTLAFTTVTQIPVSGKIILTLPILSSSDANNAASPSATTFQMNGITSSQIKVYDNTTDITSNFTSITPTNPTAGTSPVITFTLDGSTSVTAGHTLTIYLGCTAGTSSSCSTQAPRLINPTKTATAGTADTWKFNLLTQNASSVNLDSATVAVATIESVQVLATVDPTLTFTIAGVSNGSAVNTGNTTGCLQAETTNAGISATSTVVNLGLLSNTPAINTKVGNIAAQLLSVSTNATGGYAITATSAGALQNYANGYSINSSTTPAAFPASNDWFGIHACGLDTYGGTLSTTFWNTAASDTNCGTCPAGSASCPTGTGGTNVCKYGWPTQTSSVTMASDPTGPVDNTITAGNGLTSVSYASGVDASVPAGTYQSYVTYVATATF